MDTPSPVKVKREAGTFQPRTNENTMKPAVPSKVSFACTNENQSKPVVPSKSSAGLATRHPNGPVLGAAKKRTSKSAGPTKKPPAKKFKYSTKPIISAPKHHTPGCEGCRMVPCENMLSLALLHQKLKTSHYKLASYEGVDGNNRRRRHFYYEWKKDHDGKVNPCALDFARSIFPRTD
jgi:hypothetical protein